MNYIGIDNGISGAIAQLNPDGALKSWHAMPTQKTRKGNEVNAASVFALLRAARDESFKQYKGSITVIIEEPGGSKSAKAASSMAGSFHAIRAVLEVMRVRYHRITPQAWQKNILHCKAGDTKPAALSKARQLWPDELWLETERCRKPHDGAIDAALIAEYGRVNNL